MVLTRSGRSSNVVDENEVVSAGKKEKPRKNEKDATTKKATSRATHNTTNKLLHGTKNANNALSKTSIQATKKRPQFSLLRKPKAPSLFDKRRTTLATSTKNELSELIPGYRAPMQLESSCSSQIGAIADLYRKAQETDSSTRDFVVRQHQPQSQQVGTKSKESSSLYASSFKMGHVYKHKPNKQPATAGDSWFGMVPTEMTDQVKADLSLIQNRTYLDPKRFYKKADKFGTMVQVGTVVEGAAEFYSSRLSNREKRSNLVEQVMADPNDSSWTIRKYKQMQQDKSKQDGKKRRYKNKKRYPNKGRKGY